MTNTYGQPGRVSSPSEPSHADLMNVLRTEQAEALRFTEAIALARATKSGPTVKNQPGQDS